MTNFWHIRSKLFQQVSQEGKGQVMAASASERQRWKCTDIAIRLHHIC